MVIDDIMCCEDGHGQERSMLHEVLPAFKARDLLIDDRNFCTLGFLFGLTATSRPTSSPDSTAGCPLAPRENADISV